MSLREKATKGYTQRFGEPPRQLVRAPGRVNLIGEHTDYNEGFVMPLAIEHALLLACGPRDDGKVVVRSVDFEAETQFELGAVSHQESGWGEYIAGVAWALQQYGYDLKGWQGLLASDIPIGAGLSSSAALELASAAAFQVVSGFPWQPVLMARLSQYAENEWVGVNCGIMDQLAVAAAQPGFAVKLDCRSLEYEPAPLPAGVSVVIIDSDTRRGLIDSAYNERRQQCEQAAAHFGLASLRDLSLAELRAAQADLPLLIYRRAWHVLSENQRVLEAEAAMHSGQATRLGELLRESHISLRDDFEVSRPEIDTLVEIANARPECYGARITGGGFGGCVVGLVEAEAVAEFTHAVEQSYRDATGLEAACYVTAAQGGVSVEDVK